jgi:hypothetical protein
MSSFKGFNTYQKLQNILTRHNEKEQTEQYPAGAFHIDLSNAHWRALGLLQDCS